MLKNILLIFSIIFLSSCKTPARYWFKPMGYLFGNMPEGGSPGFNLGWTHGCQSGLGSQFGGAFYMTFYTWSRDPDITSSEPDFEKIRKRYQKELKGIDWNNIAEVKKNFSDYNTIFWSASSYCRHSVLGILQASTMNPTLPGDERYDPMAHSVGNVWKITGKGDTRIGTGFW